MLSTIVGAAAGIAFYRWPTLSQVSDFRTLGTTLASVAATLLGFLIAALALLASVSQHWFIRNLQRTPHFSGVLKDLYVSCAAFLLVLIVGIASLIAPAPDGPGPVLPHSALHVVICLLLGVTAGALVTLLPVGKKFWFILINLRPAGTRFEEAPPEESAA